uniref:hypothetical protein n=1 Tax=Cupriavidus gilardii TaxID=82541 RepID=UPI00247AAB5F|nr:hypothetical protein [Cupriavidus gilardii]WDE72657.1 hypothetical protein [Cupriavidus gilardii]
MLFLFRVTFTGIGHIVVDATDRDDAQDVAIDAAVRRYGYSTEITSIEFIR